MVNLLKRRFSFTYPCPRKLREIMQLSAVLKESPPTIIGLWDEYHKDKDKNVALV